MSLTGRFSALFLGALALVLVVFSTVLYCVGENLPGSPGPRSTRCVARGAGRRCRDSSRRRRVGASGASIAVGPGAGPERLRWIVFDARGHRIDHSRNLIDAELTADWVPRPGGAKLPSRLVDRPGPSLANRPAPATARCRPCDPARTPPPIEHQPEPGDRSETALPITRLDRLRSPGTQWSRRSPRWVALLVILSVGTWLLAALLCRRVSRRALAPMARMVESARELNAADPGWSLELAGTGDELDDLGRAFNGLLSRLHVAYQQQRRFSSDASHQLRTPLTILIGQIEVALQARTLRRRISACPQVGPGKGRPAPPDRRGIALPRPGRFGRTTPRRRNRRPGALGRAIPRGSVRNDHFRRNGSAIPRAVSHSRSAFIRHCWPSCSTTCSTMPTSTARRTSPIVVETLRDQGTGQAILAVEDSGAGIPAEEISRVFEPFYRSDQGRRRGVPGVGVGLAIVRRIATAFAGTASLRERRGTGLAF